MADLDETPRSNTKQFGDACEHYVVAMLGFANVPAVKMPDNWPGYDVVAQLHPGQLQQIAVQGRRWPNSGLAFRLKSGAVWDWFAPVLHYAEDGSTRCWILPRRTVLLLSTEMPVAGEHRLNISVLLEHPEWEGNFTLKGDIEQSLSRPEHPRPRWQPGSTFRKPPQVASEG